MGQRTTLGGAIGVGNIGAEDDVIEPPYAMGTSILLEQGKLRRDSRENL